MINEQNFPFYLRCLVQVSNSRKISIDDIPQTFREFFSLPALSQSLNLSTANSLSINWSEVEEYIDQNTFDNFESLAEGIREKFQSDIEKLYASYYFVVRYVSFDFDRNGSLNDQQPLNFEEVFSQKKGISIDITNFLNELLKNVNIISDDISISNFLNKSKETNWNSFKPPQTVESDHENVLVNLKGEKFISDPTFACGCIEKDHPTSYQFKKSNFLIPFYSALLMYYQEGAADGYTFDQFTALNKPNFEKELSFESNPFQKITVENGFYEMQFSFLRPDNSIGAEISMLVADEWSNKPSELVSLTCLEKELPNRHFSLNSELRCRYKMTVSFPEIGNYEVKVKLGDQILFNVYFDVVSLKEKYLTFGIPDSLKEETGFIPIVPTDELSAVTNGYARIRFAIKNTHSAIIVKLFKIKEGTFECDDEKSVDNCCRFFSVDFPFEIENNNKFNYSFVEDWILVEFPEEGRWEVKVLFGNDQTYNISYFFDVTGTCEHNVFPIFDLPKNRVFSNFPTNPMINIEPSTQSVFVDQNDLNFIVYSPNELKLSFKFDKDGSIIEPKLDAKKEWEDKPVKNWEYSVTFPEEGMYTLELWDEDKYIGAQNYFFGKVDQIEETQEEIDLMENIKTILTEKADYCKDIPISIKEEVERMFQESKENDQDQQKEPDQDQPNEQMNELVEGQINNLIDQDQNKENQQNEQEQVNNEQEQVNNEQTNDQEQVNNEKTNDQIPQIQIEIPQYDDQEYQRSPRSRGNQSFSSSPRSMASSSRSFNRPQLKKRPIKTRPPVLYTPPTYKKTESTNELQKLKEKAKKEEPLLNVSSDTLEDLLNLLYEDKKSYATKHLYKNGLICNNMIAHVMKYYELAKRKENQDFEREKFIEINKQFEESLQVFDQETKKLEKELLSKQNEKRNQLKEKQDNELTDFDNHWSSAKKQRTYNHSTNNLNALRSKLSFLLVDGRFKDAEEVQKQVNERTVYEQVSHTEIMIGNHDTSLRLLRDKHNDELETFEKNCLVEMEKFRQDRIKLRQGYLNRQLKLRTKEEIIADPNKLWMHSQTERMGNTLKNSINKGTTINSSSKMKRADIKETDAVILNLPPLESSKKSPRGKTKKVKKEEEDE